MARSKIVRGVVAAVLALAVSSVAERAIGQTPAAPPPAAEPTPAPPAPAPPAAESEAKPDSPEAIEAARLFNEGRDLAARGDHASACVRFEASHKLKPSATGPLLNLAICTERVGRLATSAMFFRDVIARSKGSNPERAQFAEEQLRQLELRVSQLKIVVPATARAAALEVKLDGRVIAEASWNESVPVDGGEHLIEAAAPGKERFVTTVRVGPERDRVVIEIPLVDEKPDRTPAYVIGGIGAVSLAVGVALGVSVAVECGGLFQDKCKGANDHPTYRERQRALETEETKAWVSNITAGVGLVGLGIGAYLLLRSPRASTTGSGLPPRSFPRMFPALSVTAHGGSFSVDGRF